MSQYKIEIRKETEADYLATEEMCMRAFWNLHGPGCDEHLFVRKLREHDDYLPEISRIATVDGKVAATIMYSKAMIRDGGKEYPVITFGPLAVDPMYQNTGIGGELLRYTMELARKAGFPGILIFGEPKYYPKHGFVTADHFGITDANGNNFDAFMAYELQEGAFENSKGKFYETALLETLTKEDALQMCKEFKPIRQGKFPCQWTYDNATHEKDGYHLEPAEHYLKESQTLFNTYIEELALYNPWLSTQKDEEGNYIPKEYAKFFTEVEKKLYIIFVENEAVGIVAMSVASFDEDTEGFSYIDEIYVDKKYRGKGIAKDIVRRYLKHQENDCGFYILKENATSIAIWENFLKKENYMFEKIDAKEKLWFYRVKIGGKR